MHVHDISVERLANFVDRIANIADNGIWLYIRRPVCDSFATGFATAARIFIFL